MRFGYGQCMADCLGSKRASAIKISLRVQYLLVRVLQSPISRAGPICLTPVHPWQGLLHTDGIRAMQVDFGGQHTLLVVTGDSAPTSTAPAAAMTTAGGILVLNRKLLCID